MSRHVWQVSTFQPWTVDQGRRALALAVRRGSSYEAALAFTGYALETMRQKGGMRSFRYRDGEAQVAWDGLAAFWGRCSRSGHRYARGKNAANYRSVGERILAGLADRAGLRAGTPPQLVWDALAEAGWPEPGA